MGERDEEDSDAWACVVPSQRERRPPAGSGGSWRTVCKERSGKEAGDPEEEPISSPWVPEIIQRDPLKTSSLRGPTASQGEPLKTNLGAPTASQGEPLKTILGGPKTKKGHPTASHGITPKITSQEAASSTQKDTKTRQSDPLKTTNEGGSNVKQEDAKTSQGGPKAMTKAGQQGGSVSMEGAPTISQTSPHNLQEAAGSLQGDPPIAKHNGSQTKKRHRKAKRRDLETNQGDHGTKKSLPSLMSPALLEAAQQSTYSMNTFIRQGYPIAAGRQGYDMTPRAPNTMQRAPTYRSQGHPCAPEEGPYSAQRAPSNMQVEPTCRSQEDSNSYPWTPNTMQVDPLYRSQGNPYSAEEGPYIAPMAPNMQGAPMYRGERYPSAAQQDPSISPMTTNNMQGAQMYRSEGYPNAAQEYPCTSVGTDSTTQMTYSSNGPPFVNQRYPCTVEGYRFTGIGVPENTEGAFSKTQGFLPVVQQAPYLNQGSTAPWLYDHRPPGYLAEAVQSFMGNPETYMEFNKAMQSVMLDGDYQQHQLRKRWQSHFPLQPLTNLSPPFSLPTSHTSLEMSNQSPYSSQSHNPNSLNRRNLSPRSSSSRDCSPTKRIVRSPRSSRSRHRSPRKRTSRSPCIYRYRSRTSRSPHSRRSRHRSRSPHSPRSRHRSPRKRTSWSPRSPSSRHRSSPKRNSRSLHSPRSRHRSPRKRTSRSPRSPSSRHRSSPKRNSRSPHSPRSRHRSPLKRISRSPHSSRSKKCSSLTRTSRSPHSSRSKSCSSQNRTSRSPLSPSTRLIESPFCEDDQPEKVFGVRVDICATFPDDNTLKEVIFGRFVKFGLVNSVEVHHSSKGRYVLVFFDQQHEQQEALIGAPKMRLYSQTLEVTPCTSRKVVDDSPDNIWDDEMVKFNPISTRTLLICNLDKSIAPEKLDNICMQYDDILDIEIQPIPGKDTCSALVEFSNITSLVNAGKSLDQEFFGTSKVKVTFAKSVPTNCLWLDGLPINLTVDYLHLRFSEYGPVANMVYDCIKGMALVRYKHDKDAIAAMKLLKCGMGKVAGHRVMVDFVSDRTQLVFCQSMKASGQNIGDFLSTNLYFC